MPNKVEVTGESKKTYQVEISSWASNPSNTYDPNSKDKQELKYAASIKEIPSELEYGNPDGPDTILTIIVEAAESTPTPTPVPPSSSPSTTDDGYVVPNTGVK